MKKIISVLLVCAMLLTSVNALLPLSISATGGGTVASGTCGESLTWVLDAEGTLTISGEGEMDSSWSSPYDENCAPWLDYRFHDIINVKIEEGVTSVGNYAFADCWSLQSVVIPDSVQRIGDYAFSSCTRLADIALGNGVQHIGICAFKSCGSLSSIVIPTGVQSIGTEAFAECVRLIEVYNLSTLEIIKGDWESHGCVGFYAQDIYNSLSTPSKLITTHEGYVFYENGETVYLYQYTGTAAELWLPERFNGKCYAIYPYAFSQCTSLTNVTIPSGVTSIGNSAFDFCYNLVSISIGETVESIGASAFIDCAALIEVTIPGSVKYIDGHAFAYCGNLKSVVFEEGVESIYNSAFVSCSNLESVSIPNSVTAIYSNAFDDCEKLTSVAIPSSVTYIGWDAFSGCDNLLSITVDEGNPVYHSYKNCLIETETRALIFGCQNSVIPNDGSVTSINSRAFYGCKNLVSITIPGSIEIITSGLFNFCSNLTSVVIEEGVQQIGRNVFGWCDNLSVLVIPDSVTSIESTFDSCPTIYCSRGSYAEAYAVEHGYPVIIGLTDFTQITLSVTDERNEMLSEGYTVNWYEEGTEEPIAQGLHLYTAVKGKTYEYEILLDENLGGAYLEPLRRKITVAEDQEGALEVACALERIPDITVTGRLTDGEGNALAGATVTSTQILNNKYIKVLQAETDQNGDYTLTLARADATLQFTMPEYYNKTVTLTALSDAAGDTYDVGEQELLIMPANKITLTLTLEPSVEDLSHAYSQSMTSFYGLQFSLYHVTQDRPITEFTLQYPNIVLEDSAVQGGDIIRISVVDTQNTMAAEPIEVVLSALKVGAGELVFLENGRIKVNNIVGADKTVAMLFDGEGKFLSSATVTSTYTSAALPEGNYRLVLMKKTTLLRSVQSMDKLLQMGLAANTDYVCKDVEVANGYITAIDGVTVPALDESKLYYTVAQSTHFTSSASSATLGKYIQMRLEYAIDPQYQSADEYVTVDIPEGVVFVENSLALNSYLVPYTKNGNEIKVLTNDNSGIIRFYVYAETVGAHNINAYLGFDNDGNAVVQPVGTASFAAEADTINAPSETGEKTVTVSGTTLPKSIVTVYDNGVAVGTVTSNKNGSWSLRFDLVKPYNYSFHEIYATIANDRVAQDVQTATSTLLYDETYISLSKITMIHNDDETVFDFLNPKNTQSYSYSSGSFTFQVEFTDGDDTAITDVYVVATNAAGENTYIPVTYDAATDMWLGTYSTDSNEDAPVAINAVWKSATEERTGNPMQLTADEWMEEYENIKAEVDALAGESSERFDVEVEELPNGSKSIIMYDKALENQKAFAYCYSIDTAEQVAENDLLAQGFEKDIYNGKVVYILYEEQSFGYLYTLIDRGAKVKNTVSFTVDEAWYHRLISEDTSPMSRQAKSRNAAVSFLQDILVNIADKCTGGLISQVQLGIEVGNMRNRVDDDYNTFVADVGRAYKYLYVKCDNGEFALSRDNIIYYSDLLSKLVPAYEARMKDVEFSVNLYHKVMMAGNWAGNLPVSKVMYTNVADFTKKELLSLAGELAPGFNDILPYICSKYGSVDVWEDINSLFRDYESDLSDIVAAIKSMYNCPPDDDDPDDPTPDPIPDPDDDQMPEPPNPPQKATPILDPSGYVYEAVPSNRVEGVKAEAYYRGEVLDDFGMPTGEWEDVLWDATEYDQVNPLYTDKNGRYAWDVPVGQWLVKFSKEGYYDTDSKNDRAAVGGYLPVPPPQVDVNVGIVSKAAPTVASINAYNDEIQIIFSQYMQLGSVNAANVVCRQNGNLIAGSLLPANAEYNYEGTVQYASIFTFVPDSDIEGTVEIGIENVINYAGTVMAAAYTDQMAVKSKPESVSLPESIQVNYGETLTVPVQILPAQAGQTLTLTITSSSPSIVTVETATVTTNADGVANVILRGALPGQSNITVAIEGTDISAAKAVSVAMKQRTEANRCEKVVADIASGTEIAAGTQITLSTPTEGAEIYYTLDKTCPCVVDSPSRIKYEGPITVNENVFIIAYAVKDGYEESATSQFIYTVRAVCDHSASTSRPDCDQAAVCSVCGGNIAALGHTFVWVTDKAATATEDGIKHEECFCGAKRNENTAIPKTDVNQMPEEPKGNSAVIWIVVGVSVVSVGAIAAAVFIVIKKRKSV